MHKGIVSGSNIFLWHESDNINKKVISKISVDSNFMLTSLVQDYVHWHCSIDYCVKLILIDENLCENWFYFTLKWFLLNSFDSFEDMCLEEIYK